MTLFVYVNGVEMASRLRLQDGLQSVTSNADGTYGASGLKFDDPNGDLTIGRFQNVIINETACTPSRLFTGYVIEARPTRGPYVNGVGRVWNVDVGDLNVLSHLQAFHTADAKRPQETGTARRDWLLGTTQARYFHNAGLAADFSGLFDEADYRGQYPDDVLSDISGPISRVFFLYWTNTSTQVGLYWAGANDGISTSTLSISNNVADLSPTTDPSTWTVFPPDPAAELIIDMSEVYDEVILNWTGGSTFASDYDGRMPTGMHRTGVFETPRVGRATTAAAEAQILLDRYSGDAESITCTVLLPKNKVNLIDAGMLVPVKFTHLPGYTAFTNLRVAQRSVNLAPNTDDLYAVTLKLNLRGVTSTGGGGTNDFPHDPGCTTPTIIQTKVTTGVGTGVSGTFDVEPTVGNTLVVVVASRVGAPGSPLYQSLGTPSAGYTAIPEGSVDGWPAGSRNLAIFYKTAVAGDSVGITSFCSSTAAMIMYELPPLAYNTSGEVRTADTFSNTATGPAITPTAGSEAIIIGGFALGTDIDGLGNMTPGAGWTEDADTLVAGQSPRLFAVHQIVSSASGSYTPSGTHSGGDQMVADGHGYGGQAVAFICDSSSTPPPPGKWIYGETPTPAPGGGRVTFFTAFPFADNSLQVFVDQTDQTAAIVSYNGATGSFTLAFDPRSWETLLVNYQGR